MSLSLALWLALGFAEDSPAIDFGRDIRPLLSDRCFSCHGPDERMRKRDLRLDVREDAVAERRRGSAIVPFDRAASRLFQRITADRRPMPPDSSGKSLTPEEIELLGQWIDAGAQYEAHWAFEAPRRPELPGGSEPHPIDRFVSARLRAEGLAPSAPADRETLIRRVSFDLTGLPPSPGEIDAFLADTAPNAYERLVDRLLGSPHYGEHFARDWLDAARYADTNGYQYDTERTMWPWRDWVIRALNDNMPFDRFTIEQLAGDLLERPTLDQRIATGFNRNHGITIEGGVIQEEYRTEYVIDRVSTTSTVWLGLTAGCARCHDHKFDPLSQKEFYQLFAFFNQVDERGMGNDPVVRAPSEEQREALASLEQEIAETTDALSEDLPKAEAARREWQASLAADSGVAWTVLEPLATHSSGGSTFTHLEDHSLLVSGANPSRDVYEVTYRLPPGDWRALRLEALTHESLPHRGPGRHQNANFVLSELEAEWTDGQGNTQPVRIAAAWADYSQSGYEIAKAVDGTTAGNNGWAVDGPTRREDRVAWLLLREPIPEAGELRIRLRHEAGFATHGIGRFRIAAGRARFADSAVWSAWESAGPFVAEDFESSLRTDTRALATEAGWTAHSDWTDGRVHALEGDGVASTLLRRTIETEHPRTWTLFLGSDDALRIRVNGELLLDRPVRRGVAPDQDQRTLVLPAGTHELLLEVINAGGGYGFFFDAALHPGTAALDVGELAALPDVPSNPQRQARLREYHLDHASPPDYRRLVRWRAALEKERAELEMSFPATLVMRDREAPRQTFVLERGQYDRPAEEVNAAVPTRLTIEGLDVTPNRLGLARWLVHPRHPLMARVTVNRFWHHYFGTGLVETLEDFGHQGSWPSHPQLLDWLAVDFIESGWDVKRLQKLIVTSETYQQSSKLSPELRERDPANRLLARGPRRRLSAETIRDAALAMSGLLVRTIGGPSVYPYQPAGLWMELNNRPGYSRAYPGDSGDDLYRRSLYTFWKRTVPHPAMRTFDAPERETCVVRRSRTNTPLQALVLLHDPEFVEAARGLAGRLLRESHASDPARLVSGFRWAVGRRPSDRELGILRRLLERRRQNFAQSPEAAMKLLAVGEHPVDPDQDPAELAAWTEVARALLNLDETITNG